MKRSESRQVSSDASVSEIVECYSPRLRAYILRQVENRDDAEDILQDVFYKLVKTTRSGAGDIEKMSAWLYRVARNAILNLWRKRREVGLPQFDDYGEETACENFSELLFGMSPSDPESVYLRKLVWEELAEALACLPPEQSEVFCATVFDGVPVKEISADTGVPVATLLSRKHYAVKFLRMRLRWLYEDLLDY